FVEQLDGETGTDPQAVHYLEQVMARFDFDGRWALLTSGGTEPTAMTRDRLRKAADQADLVLNISGKLSDPDVLERVGVRAYLDLAPVLGQIWQAGETVARGFGAHTHFVSVADAIGSPGCPIPDCGRQWLPTLPPVVLEEWPLATELERRRATTVGHWRSYGS